MKITWLASYPKSGNTYLRFLLYHYLFGTPEHSNDVQKRIVDLHKLISKKQTLNLEKKKRAFVKTHYPFSLSHPCIEATEAFVYILRNPVDVMLSNASYLGYPPSNPDKFSKFAANYINAMGCERWINLKYGTWPENVGSWTGAISKTRGCIIRYEDLRHETARTFSKVLNFLNIEVDEPKLKKAIKECNIGNMKKMEQREGATGVFKTLSSQSKFVNQGKTNQSLADIDAKIASQFTNRFGDLMEIYGYNHS